MNNTAAAEFSSNRSHSTQFLPKWLKNRRSSLCTQPIAVGAISMNFSNTISGMSKSSANRRYRPAIELPSPSDPEPETRRDRIRHARATLCRFVEPEGDPDEQDEFDSCDGPNPEAYVNGLAATNNNNNNNISNTEGKSQSKYDGNYGECGGQTLKPKCPNYWVVQSMCTPVKSRPAANTLPDFRRANRHGSVPDILIHSVSRPESSSFIADGCESRSPRSASRFSQIPRTLFSKWVHFRIQ